MNSEQQKLQEMDGQTRAYQGLLGNLRFKQSLVQGVGAAMVFGLATGVFGMLLKLAVDPTFMIAAAGNVAAPTVNILGASIGAATLAWGAIAVGLVVGVGCLYVGSKLAAEMVRIEQTHHAAQIAKGINNAAPEMGHHKPAPYLSQEQVLAAPEQAPAPLVSPANVPQPSVNHVTLFDKVVPIDALAAKARA